MKKSLNKAYTVDDKSSNLRLDVFLAEELKITRSQAQKFISEDKVLLNDKLPKKAGERVKTNDKLTINNEQLTNDQKVTSYKLQVTKSNQTAVNSKQIDIITETPDYLVVNKPAGMLTHSTNKNEPDSLAALLVKKYPELKKVSDEFTSPSPSPSKGEGANLRHGIVHRLDKEASGLLVVARTQKMFNHLKEQFKNRTVEKEYSVLVHGVVAKDWSEIKFPIKRGENDRMIAIPLTHRGIELDLGKSAHTEFEVIKRYINLTLLRVIIHTGRMHQIRVHLLAYNHPVVGDPIYYQKKRPDKWDDKCGRLFLHCSKLGFVDLEGQKQVFEAELPAELSEFLKILR